MRILAIETSCDETAVSVLSCSGTTADFSFDVLGTGLYSQASKHAQYGGVYPNLAKREHQKNLIPMLKIALEESGLSTKHKIPVTKGISNIKIIEQILEREDVLLTDLKQFLEEAPHAPDIDAIAVTQGPGLEPALWVGLNFAKALSRVWNLPLIPVNHMEGHVLSVLHEYGKNNPKSSPTDVVQNTKIEFPAVALLVSGGHTELVLIRDWLSYERIGETRDDAVGEAFDKVARLLGLPYPGGPHISALAEISRNNAEQKRNISASGLSGSAIRLPRPMIGTDDYDFSFSGLKTAVLYEVKKQTELTDTYKRELAREFEDAVTDVLCVKTRRAAEDYGARTLMVGGGVIANAHIRAALTGIAEELGVSILLPSRELSTDNAVMIGIAGFLNYAKTPDSYCVYDPVQTLAAKGTLRIGGAVMA